MPDSWFRSDAFDRPALKVLVASIAALYFELLIIRYLGTEIRVFTNLKNIPLIACFFGLGLGMVLDRPARALRFLFPVIGLVLFCIARYAQALHLTNIDLLWTYDLAQNVAGNLVHKIVSTIRFVGLVLGLSGLVVSFCVVLGQFIGEPLRSLPGLKGYALNLAGSLIGALLFTLVSILGFGPPVWLLIGFLILLPLVAGKWPILVFAVTLAAVAVPEPRTVWSPYSRIDYVPLPAAAGSSEVGAYSIVANHLWHQWAADLSPAFLQAYPSAVPNSLIAPYAAIVYHLAPHPRNVLVLGAGTGNDVAGALRAGAQHIDAVEIDSQILALGKRFHPEHPYDSPRVVAHLTDARSYLRNTDQKYDLILFAFLDSTTLLSGLSSIRLDNYVYTVESFADARRRLTPDGTLILSFATGPGFATDRIAASLQAAFDEPPAAYFTNYGVQGVLLVEGQGRRVDLTGVRLVQSEPAKKGVLLATDDWPFLYLAGRSVPPSILVASGFFLMAVWFLLRQLRLLDQAAIQSGVQFLLLGAGFLLLETKAVNQMSLLLGTTWFVNVLVISAFLLMALLSVAVAASCEIPVWPSFGLLLVVLAVDYWFPYAYLNTFAYGAKIVLAGLWCALPVLFSGLIFSAELKKFASPSVALGVNLFGAVLGGILENSVMIGGTRVLGLLALGLYGLSALAILRNQGRTSATRGCVA